jgi:hypothetical protein
MWRIWKGNKWNDVRGRGYTYWTRKCTKEKEGGSDVSTEEKIKNHQKETRSEEKNGKRQLGETRRR